MIDTDKLLAGTLGTFVSATGASLSVTEVQAIVSIVCTIVGLLITIVTAIVIPVWKKVRDAKKDGKITPEELEDITKTLNDGLNKLRDENKQDENEDK